MVKWIVAAETLVIAATLVAPAQAQLTRRVSVSSTGAQGNDVSLFPSISGDGRFVVFESSSSNLVPGDTNGFFDVFVRNRAAGTTERVSIAWDGTEANNGAHLPAISADGRIVVFVSDATNLVPGDTNAFQDVFVRDRQNGTTVRASVDSSGAQTNADSFWPAISADGRFVAFASDATNLVGGDTNGFRDFFVHDLVTGTTERVSVATNGAQGNANIDIYPASFSSDGRYVAFASYASNLVPGDANSISDVFVRDRLAGTTELVSKDSGGVQGNGGSWTPGISADGRYVAFESFADNLVFHDTNGNMDIFVHDRSGGTTERVSVDSFGGQANGRSDFASLSADGRFVTFQSAATNLVPGDLYFFEDVFFHDRRSGTTSRMSVSSGGAQGNDNSAKASISADGRFVAFQSGANNLDSGDSNLATDDFVRDRHATGFTSICEPGVGGVIACPCSNPPAGSERGCDNSAGTGGASLAAAGLAYIYSDDLVFTSSAEKPTATSILVQGTIGLAHGAVYGQGVRCVGGTLERLFTKAAVAGSITAPDFNAGDPSVSDRSAALGDRIQPGQSRWYFVFYRDPTVLGGCPAGSTFNTTQTGRVDWSP